MIRIVGGDTDWERGVKWWLLESSGGLDAAEPSERSVKGDKRKAIAARDGLCSLSLARVTFFAGRLFKRQDLCNVLRQRQRGHWVHAFEPVF